MTTRPTVRALLLWGPVVAYMAAIYFVSAMPKAPLPPDVSDKSAHVLAYAVMGVLVVRALAGGLPPRVTPAIAIGTLLIATGHGVLDEVHQSFVPGRFADAADVLADGIGAWLGLMGCWAWGIIRARSDV